MLENLNGNVSLYIKGSVTRTDTQEGSIPTGDPMAPGESGTPVGPEDEPWFVLYSVDGVLVKYKTLQ